MRRAIGAEFPQRRAVSIRARSGQAWKFARANVRDVVVAMNVARDQVKGILLAGQSRAEAHSRCKGRAHAQQIVDFILPRRVEQELDAQPKELGRVSAVDSPQLERYPLALKERTERQLQLKSVQLQNHDALGWTRVLTLFFGSVQSIFCVG